MSTEEKNVEILKRAYQQWVDNNAQDIDCWVSIVADDARLTSLADGSGDLQFTRSRSGRSEITDYLKGLTAEWDMIFYRIDEYIADGDRVVAVGATSWRNKRTGKVVVTPKVDVWRMRNGLIVQFSEFYDTAKLIAAAQP